MTVFNHTGRNYQYFSLFEMICQLPMESQRQKTVREIISSLDDDKFLEGVTPVADTNKVQRKRKEE